MKKLILNLKGEYFDEIKVGKKTFEYRLCNEYWKKRLVNREYDIVEFRRGYPKNTETDKIISMPYLGWELRGIRHKHFGNTGSTDKQVDVYAIHCDINYKQIESKEIAKEKL